MTEIQPGANDSVGNTRETILGAAAALFAIQGWSGTTTRAIATAARVQQPSMYYYFKSKDDILATLLRRAAMRTWHLVDALINMNPPATSAEHLYALAAHEGAQFTDARTYVGALYQLPELRTPSFVDIWADRQRRRCHFRRLSEDVVGHTGVTSAVAHLPFHLVESLATLQSDEPLHVADGCLTVLGFPRRELPALRSSSLALLERFAPG
jgi:AcrR family transcriptional regulator